MFIKIIIKIFIFRLFFGNPFFKISNQNLIQILLILRDEE